MAYWEQVGTKRQLGGSTGEMKRWYTRMRDTMRFLAIKVFGLGMN